MSLSIGRDVGVKLSKILGIERVVDIDLSFHMHDIPRATVTFLVDDIKANAIVELLEDTKWGQNDV